MSAWDIQEKVRHGVVKQMKELTEAYKIGNITGFEFNTQAMSPDYAYFIVEFNRNKRWYRLHIVTWRNAVKYELFGHMLKNTSFKNFTYNFDDIDTLVKAIVSYVDEVIA